MKTIFLFCVIFLINSFLIKAQQEKTTWDNTENKYWPTDFVETKITSSIDSSIQMAMFYKTRKISPQPLIISLHTWIGDYRQEDPLANEIILRDWNYIHPNFRGPNNTSEACGSNLVVHDIEDAINYAISKGNVDKNQVHIIGVSGGGYAALLAFMGINYPVKSFNAYASISNLEDWYWECRGRGLKYAKDLEKVTTGDNGFDPIDARKRSPMFMKYQNEKRNGSFLNIYAGIHDGYVGSVPITHSINMFNKLLQEMYPLQTNKLISDSLIISLLTKRMNSSIDTDLFIGGRKIHLIKELPNLNITIFEGGHEMIVPQALALIPVFKIKTKKLRILTIGDSNAAINYGWPEQLRKLLPYSTIINKSISGNTIGFDNLGQEKLNTIRNINQYLDQAYSDIGDTNFFDYIFIGLGTNDSKRIFENQQKDVPGNLSILIQKIKTFVNKNGKSNTTICLILSPPVDEEKANLEKYGGADKRIRKNIQRFKKIALINNVNFLDTYTFLKKGFADKTDDGIHLNEKAQFQLASMILNYVSLKEK